MEIMSVNETVWKDHHRVSSFLPNASSVDFDLVSLINTDVVNNPPTPVLLQGTNSEGNLCNITQKTPIDISVRPKIVEYVHVGQNCSKK